MRFRARYLTDAFLVMSGLITANLNMCYHVKTYGKQIIHFTFKEQPYTCIYHAYLKVSKENYEKQIVSCYNSMNQLVTQNHVNLLIAIKYRYFCGLYIASYCSSKTHKNLNNSNLKHYL